mgnify:CR=1 FL=1
MSLLDDQYEWNKNKKKEQCDLHNVSYCDGSYQRHQESLHDEINEALSKRSFDNEELQLILDVIKNIGSFKQVFKIINSCS